jgi:hypothetical protein
VAGAGESGHVDADLCDQLLGAAPFDPRDRDQGGHLRLERGDHPVDLGGKVEDDLVEEVELGQDLTD